jgi:hypothetical protein
MGMEVHNGTHRQLEAYADELIKASLEGVTSREDKSDIITPWKAKHRGLHEILSRSGAPIDPAIMRGSFHKAWNPDKPHLNSREGVARAPRMPSSWDPEEIVIPTVLSSQMAAAVGVDRFDY